MPATVDESAVEKLILDGQQRLTSLTQVLKLGRAVKTRDEKKRPIERYYYIDIAKALEGPLDEAFFAVDKTKTLRENFGRDVVLDLSTPELEYAHFCFPCSQILNSDEWEAGLHTCNPGRFSEYMQFRKQILGKFRNYDVPVIELKKDNRKEAVCLVFEKVNTGGVPLSVFELVTATYAADGVNLRDEWYGREDAEGIASYLRRQRLLREVQPTEFLQGLSLLHTYDLRNRDLAAGKTGKQVTGVSAKRESVLGLPLEAYLRLRDRLRDGYVRAAKFLRKESFYSTKDLPYRTQLVPLACILALLEDRWQERTVYEKLSRWFWCGVLGELYGGAVETRMALDVPQVMAWIGGAEDEPATVRDANFQPGRLDTLRSRNSAAYKGLHVLVQRNGAKDWFWNTTIRDLDETDWEECGDADDVRGVDRRGDGLGQHRPVDELAPGVPAEAGVAGLEQPARVPGSRIEPAAGHVDHVGEPMDLGRHRGDVPRRADAVLPVPIGAPGVESSVGSDRVARGAAGEEESDVGDGELRPGRAREELAASDLT